MTSDELEALAAAATPGEWNVQDFTVVELQPSRSAQDVTISCTWPDYIGVASMCGGLEGSIGVDQARTDANFIAALVNAYRAGELVHRDDVPTLQPIETAPKEHGE